MVISPMLAQAGNQEVIYALFSRGWPPFEMVVQGEPQGLVKDLFNAAMPEGLRLSVLAAPAPRKLLYQVEDIVYVRLEAQEWMSKSKRDRCLWSDPVFSLETVLYSSADAPLDYAGPESLKGKTVGCIKNYTYPKLEPAFKDGTIKRYDVNNNQVLFRMLNAGRIDAIVMDSVEAKWVIRTIDDVTATDFHVAANPVDVVDLRFAFSKSPGWEKRLPDVNRRISKLRKSGTFKDILNQYD